MTDPIDDLAEVLAEDFAHGDETVGSVEPYPDPPDMSRAAWHAKWAKIETLRAAAIKQVYDDEIERLTQRREMILGHRTLAAARHEDAIDAWHRAAFAAGEVGKTVEFPHGTSKLRTPPPAFDVIDDEDFRAWALVHGVEEELWPVKEPVLSRRALSRYAQAAAKHLEPHQSAPAISPDGEVIDGLIAWQGEATHSFKAASDE